MANPTDFHLLRRLTEIEWRLAYMENDVAYGYATQAEYDALDGEVGASTSD